MRKIVFMLAFLFIGMQVFAQSTITGTVTDNNDQSVPGVNVWVKGFSDIGTITDMDGKYTISVPAEATTLGFSFMGMKTREVAIGGQTTINVVLESEDQFIDDVVVTALGITRSKKALGYAVQEVNSDELKKSGKSDMVSALQGKVAGVDIISGGGAGNSTRIVIRGVNSLDPNADNQPLFVIDGVPMSNQTVSGNVLPSAGSNAGGSNEQFGFSNRAMDINPDDIESMSILKGAAATALYGARAANGAVIITTKKGKKGTTVINFSSKLTLDKVTRFPEMQETWGRGLTSDIDVLDLTPEPVDPSSDFGTFVEWGYKRADVGESFYTTMEDFFETGITYNNSLAISSGTDKGNYYFSASDLRQTGIVPNTSWGRKSVKLNGTRNITERFSTSASLSFTNSGGRRGNHGDKSYMSSMLYWPNSDDMKIYKDENGAHVTHPYIDNPYYLLERVQFNDNVNRIMGFVNFDYKINDNISLKYRIGNDNYSDSRTYIVPWAEVPGEQAMDVSTQVHGFIIEERINFNELNSDVMINFNYDLTEDLKLNLLLGQNVMAQQYDRLNTRGENWASPGFYDISNTAFKFSSNSDQNYRMVGFYGDLRLDFKDYLFLDITGRNDISSTLPIEARSYFYPSVSLGFVFSDAFGINSDKFSYGKLRASWATVGKDAPPHRLDKLYTAYTHDVVTGLTKDNSLGNTLIEPEFTTSIELGLDLRFMNNRVGVDFGWYKANTVNMLYSIPVAYTTGYSSILDNIGELENKGIEVLLTATPVKTDNFSWNISMNFSKNKTKVIDLRDDLEEIQTSSGYGGVFTKLVEGGYAGDMYGYTWNMHTNDDGTESPIMRTSGSYGGTPDLNWDSTYYIGNVNPDWAMGITQTLNYKGLTLSFLIDIKQGMVMSNEHVRNLIRQGKHISTENRPSRSEGGVILDGVMDDGNGNMVPNTTPIQRYRSLYRYRTPFNAFDFVDDASWIRLRSLSLSYALPKSVFDNVTFIKGLTASFTGTNLFLKTEYRGFDPEMSKSGAGSNAQGYSGYSTPNTTSYGFALNFTF
ncbi:MAG: SusC/RagA family TonB-linked outer membrane protein [Bacteroidota bacterium]